MSTRRAIRSAKPDVYCRFEGDRLDLDVAHLYGGDQEAMQILKRELSGLS
jgi:hypothetical protein